MTTDYKPLSDTERRDLLAVLNAAVAELYPDLGMPYLVAVQAVHEPLTRITLEGRLPAEVVKAVAVNPGRRLLNIQRGQLGKYLFEDEHRNARARSLLGEQIESALARCSRIDAESFQLFWRNLQEIETPTQLLWILVKAFTPCDAGGREDAFVDVILYEYQEYRLANRILLPSERYAVYQVLRLVAANASRFSDQAIQWIGRLVDIGAYDLAPALLGISVGTSRDLASADGPFRLAEAITSRLEGVLSFLGAHLSAYLDALEQQEQRYYRHCLPPGKVPTLAELRRIYKESRSRPHAGSLRRQMRRHHAVDYAHTYWHHYRPLRDLLAVLFYAEPSFVQGSIGKRLLHLARRCLAYWRLRDARGHYGYGDRPFGRDQWDQVIGIELLRRAVLVWQRLRKRPEDLLRHARMLLRYRCVRRWGHMLNCGEGRASNLVRLLSLWLLELRALRLFGQDSPQWAEANRLARQRFTHLDDVLFVNYATDSPDLILLCLEAKRQLAIACRGLDCRHASWDFDIQGCARELLVRLESIGDPAVRRRLSGFLRPILTAFAGSLAQGPATVGAAFCLFEQARSRWLLDHLAADDRTLAVAAQDKHAVRALKERLFVELYSTALTGEPIMLRPIPPDLWVDLEKTAPELARLVTACWPDLDRLNTVLPADALLLAYHVEDDPAEPPRLNLDGSTEPWPAIAPGCDARLWIFQLRRGDCQVRCAAMPAAEVMRQARRLQCQAGYAYQNHGGQPEIDWRDPVLNRRYEALLAELAGTLLATKEEVSDWPTEPFPLLILPCGELFQLPWPALPLHDGRRLIEVAVPCLLPGLGPALWLGMAPDRDRLIHRVEVFLRRASATSSGLTLPESMVTELRRAPFHLHEGDQATPDHALAAFGYSEAIVFLCHGRQGAEPGLELAPTAHHPDGRLTVTDLERMPPTSHAAVVVLGSCWSGLEARHAAEDVAGLTAVLFLKGVRAVLSGLGWVPVPLLEVAVHAVLPDQDATVATLAGRLREDLLRYRDSLGGAEAPTPCWAVLLLHGIPY